MLTLIARSLRRIAVLTAALSALLAAFQFAIVAVAASYERAGSFAFLSAIVPDFAKGHIGAGLASFAAMTTTGYFEPMIVMLVAQFAIYVAAEPAADIETGLVDTVLTRSLPRHWIVSRSLIVMAIGTLILMIAMGSATGLGLRWLAPPRTRWPEARVVLLLIVNLLAVTWAFGAATLAAAGWARRRVSAQAPLAVAAIAYYLLNFLASMWAPARSFAWLSPFHYFAGAAILSGGGNLPFNLAVLGAIALVAAAVAYWRFERRDL
jgi:ABC-type transport system involved in multi-copper enzyme maturation permease subunit